MISNVDIALKLSKYISNEALKICPQYYIFSSTTTIHCRSLKNVDISFILDKSYKAFKGSVVNQSEALKFGDGDGPNLCRVKK